ncbi:hypothetical protein ALC53_03285 [Atta colombica]|uniref:Uncharacterized protein n=1 Tax=Atta colombica TaxID=520822 RepID=A0A195BPT3_9HYME|nr:hypothetical protein ALC53_03285 [Atta colombica]
MQTDILGGSTTATPLLQRWFNGVALLSGLRDIIENTCTRTDHYTDRQFDISCSRGLETTSRCKIQCFLAYRRIHVALFNRERTSLLKHYKALVTDSRARDVSIIFHRSRSVLVLDEIALNSPTESSNFAETNDRMKMYLRDPIYLERRSP